MTKDDRIKTKRDDLMRTFSTLSEEELQVASGLIDQAAFLAVTLEDLADVIKAEGVTEEYTNGANQAGRKISSNAKAYTAMVGKYTTITSKLLQMVPKTSEMTFSERLDAMGKEERDRRYRLYLKAINENRASQEDYRAFMLGQRQ